VQADGAKKLKKYLIKAWGGNEAYYKALENNKLRKIGQGAN